MYDSETLNAFPKIILDGICDLFIQIISQFWNLIIQISLEMYLFGATTLQCVYKRNIME